MAKKPISFYGNEIKVGSYFDTASHKFLETETIAAFDIATTRSDSIKNTFDVDYEDVIELEYEDGLIRVVTLDELEKEARQNRSRGIYDEADTFILPSHLESYEPSSRGLLKNLLKKLKIIKVNEKIVELSALALAAKIENQLEPAPGLYHCQNPNKLSKKAQNISVNGPLLVLIHGTASSTAGSFGGFYEDNLPSPAWKAMLKTYSEHMYAFEHATLTQSPLQNTIDLLGELPKNAIVHLISHSRGGLVGEILCRNLSNQEEVFSAQDIELFEMLGRKKDVTHLKIINKLSKDKNIRVERFVRVACPAAGTILASNRVDIYLTVILNLLGLIPVLKASPIYAYVKAFLIAFVKKKEDAKVFPGLEAMIPGSPLIRILNNPNIKIDSELFVVAGDVKAHGVLRSLAVILSDTFYRTQHDFVVNTLSMFGSASRDKTYYAFHCNKNVSHFRYFMNKVSQDNIVMALSGYDTTPLGYKPLTMLIDDEGEIGKIRGGLNYVAPDDKDEKEAPHVYVLPGIMGSKLQADNDAIWVNPLRLAIGDMQRLKIKSKKVEAYALMGSSYRALLKELDKKYNVVPFPYDWRVSIIDSAKKLAEDLECRMAKTDQPIQIIAHSMGGLVVHAMYSAHQKVWEDFSSRIGSMAIFLGSPLRGSHIIPSLFLRKHKLFKILHSIDITNSSGELLEIIKCYPGLLELLPMNADRDYNKITTWKEIGEKEEGFVEPLAKDLNDAKKLQALYAKRPIEGPNIIYIAGKDLYTPYKLEYDTNGKATLWGTSKGDSCVTWETGIPKSFEGRTWYMRASHGALCSTKEFFPAIIELLETGSTKLLPNQPIMVRGESEEFVMPEEYPIVLSSERAVEDAIMGISPNLNEEIPELQVSVEISHGDLGNAKFPVAVGHHYNDPIVSAESIVDFYMNNRLSQNHSVGLYPERIESSLVLLTKEANFKGAIVLGLGVYGELNEGQLAASFRHAFIDYAMSKISVNDDCNIKEKNNNNPVLGVSSLLIASDYSGLSIRTSIRALLMGVLQANKGLRNIEGLNPPQIDSIEIIEIYKDRAIQAMHELIKIIREPDFADQFILTSSYIRETPGRRRRIAQENRQNWWHRLKVEEVDEDTTNQIPLKLLSLLKDPKQGDEVSASAKKLLMDHFIEFHESRQNPLKFTSLTDRARAEEEIKSTQRNLIDRLIEASVNTNTWNEETAKTLFHLLIPNNFKDYATDNKNIILIVDEQSASYPWEILHYPSERNNAPIATQIGLIRQLVTKQYTIQVNQTVVDSILIIGNPKTDIESRYPSLPYATEEALSVLEIFRKESYQTTHAIEEDGMTTINKLFSSNYKVIHMAGHGIVNTNDPSKTGMVLDRKTYITAAEIESLPQTPEFVFINCCYLGEVEKNQPNKTAFNKLAANVGTQFIQKGVKAVVAAGWAIDDSAAQYFAKNMYTFMFDGLAFGEAVQKARLFTYKEYGNTNTWGAYQCYGDPYYKITKSKRKSEWKPMDFVDNDEVLIELENLSSRSEAASSRDRGNLRNEVESLIARIPSKWLDNCKIVEAIGVVYYELNLYFEAEKYLQQLRYLPDGTNSLDSLNKLANILTKLALKEFEETGKLSRGARAKINEAEKMITNVLNIGITHRRLSLKGGHFKRKALTETSKSNIIKNLIISANAYRDAHNLMAQIEPDYYTIINWLTLERISELFGKPRNNYLKSASDQMKDLKEQLKQRSENSTSFWILTYTGAVGIYEIMKGDIESNGRINKINEIKENYKKHWCNGGSIRKSENILGQVNFSIWILKKLLTFESDLKKSKKQTEVELIIGSYESLMKELKGIFIK